MSRVHPLLLVLSIISLVETPRASAQQTVVGEVPATPTVDEGFSFYTLEHTSVSGSTPPISEWWLKANLRVIGPVAPRSVLKYILSKGRERIGEVRCETRTTFSANRPTESFPHVFTTRCHDRNLRVRDTGDFSVEWHLIDGNTDVDVLLTTHTVKVRNAPRFDVGSQRPWYPAPYVDRHGELLSSILWQHPNGFPGYEGGNVAVQAGARLDILVNASPAWGTNALQLSESVLRCRVDGAPVDLRTPYRVGNMSGTRTDAIRVGELDSTLGEAMVPNPSGNPRYDNVQYLFRRYLLALPLTFGAPGAPGQRPDATPVGAHPGAWECDWRTSDARTLRTFRFVVGADGLVAPHAEQSEGGLVLAPGAVFVETVVPDGNPLDARSLPEAATSLAFSGRGLRSDAARALVREVRAVGQAAPSEGRAGAERARRGRR